MNEGGWWMWSQIRYGHKGGGKIRKYLARVPKMDGLRLLNIEEKTVRVGPISGLVNSQLHSAEGIWELLR